MLVSAGSGDAGSALGESALELEAHGEANRLDPSQAMGRVVAAAARDIQLRLLVELDAHVEAAILVVEVLRLDVIVTSTWGLLFVLKTLALLFAKSKVRRLAPCALSVRIMIELSGDILGS